MSCGGVGGGFMVMDNQAVLSTATAYGYSTYLGFARGVSLGVRVKSSTAAPTIKVDWESSYKKPATEQAADTSFVVPTNVAVPWSALTGVASDATGVWVWQQIHPPKSEYGRPKITGNATNPTTTTVDLIVHLDEGP